MTRNSLLMLICLTGYTLTLLVTQSGFAFQESRQPESWSPLTDQNFAAWRDCIRAKKSELAWQELPWVTSFHYGLEKAAAEGKPLLLWAMNGHPMGCT